MSEQVLMTSAPPASIAADATRDQEQEQHRDQEEEEDHEHDDVDLESDERSWPLGRRTSSGYRGLRGDTTGFRSRIVLIATARVVRAKYVQHVGLL